MRGKEKDEELRDGFSPLCRERTHIIHVGLGITVAYMGQDSDTSYKLSAGDRKQRVTKGMCGDQPVNAWQV